MPFAELTMRPGVNTQATKLLNEGGFSASDKMRFQYGMAQKIGGCQHLSTDLVNGTCRGLHKWSDLNSDYFIGVGTNQMLQLYYGGTLYDITPAQHTSNLTTPFATTNTSSVVTVTDAGYSPSKGDWIRIATLTYVGGLLLQGDYQVTSVTGSTYTFDAGSPATSDVVAGGAVMEFTTTLSSNLVQVQLGAYAFSDTQTILVYVSTTVGGVTLQGYYTIDLSGGLYYIASTTVATSGASAYENSDQVRIIYDLPAAAEEILSGYGVGNYGAGPYGTGGSPVITLRQWSLDNWGQVLVASPSNGPVYEWTPTSSGPNIPVGIGNDAARISNAPTNSIGMFVAMPQRQMVCYGSNLNSATGGATPVWGTQDPLLVNWSDVDDYTVWTASTTNQAGSFRIASGSRIVGGIQAPLQAYLWTDIEMWAMNYIGYPLVYGFTKLGVGCGLLARRGAAKIGPNIYWIGQNGFFVFDGSAVRPLQCNVWDQIFNSSIDAGLDLNYADAVFAAPNSHFNEIFWFYPTVGSNGVVTSYVKYNIVDNVWDYGTWNRTAWEDQGVGGISYGPIAVSGASQLLLEHEASNNDDGVALDSYVQTGWFKLSEGSNFISLYRILPDFILSSGATAQITVQMIDYLGDTPTTFGPYSITSSTDFIIVRGRGRFANIKFESSDLNSFWRLGKFLAQIQPAGRR